VTSRVGKKKRRAALSETKEGKKQAFFHGGQEPPQGSAYQKLLGEPSASGHTEGRRSFDRKGEKGEELGPLIQKPFNVVEEKEQITFVRTRVSREVHVFSENHHSST